MKLWAFTETPSHLKEGLKNLLEKRYAVEKMVGFKKLLWVMGLSFFSFAVFQIVIIVLSSGIENLFSKYLLISFAIIILSSLWAVTWKLVGEMFPKFVFIGLLGWLFIIVNITPNLIIGDQWGVKAESGISAPGNEAGRTENKSRHFSSSMPLNRFLSLSDRETGKADSKCNYNILNYIERFAFPILLLRDCETHCGKRQVLQAIDYPESKIAPIFQVLVFLFFYFCLFFNISTYKDDAKPRKWTEFLYKRNHLEREKRTWQYLVVVCVSLFSIGFFSLNYFVLFWIMAFLAAIFLFKWEIKQHGKCHKPWSRSILLVILAQFFSSITGEILFLALMPAYTDIGKDYVLFSISDTIVLGWLIFLGSTVTVLIGILTQVLWSGKRMTEEIRT